MNGYGAVGASELPTVLTVQFGLGVYGGYFGGAVGIMMMAIWGLLDNRDLKV